MSVEPPKSQASWPGALSHLSLHLLPLTQLVDKLVIYTCHVAQGGHQPDHWREVGEHPGKMSHGLK